VGEVPGIEQETFAELATSAKAGCPGSRALSGVPKISLEAVLA
jgi:organic hydroperoxide reductase OsmC/OhrA